MLHWNWNCITKSFKRNLETLLRLELVKVYRFLLSLASSARPSSSRNAVSSFSSLESLSWGGMKAGHNSTWDNPEKGKKDEKTLKLLRKERVWNILCIDCDREKTAFFGSASSCMEGRDALHLFKSSMPHCLSVGSLHCLFASTAKP